MTLPKATRLAGIVIPILFIIACGAGSEDWPDPNGPSTGKADDPGSGGQWSDLQQGETILVASTGIPASLMLLRIGEQVEKIPVPHSSADFPVKILSRFGKFYVLFRDGEVITVNGTAGTVESSVVIEEGESEPFGFELVTEEEAFISFRSHARVVRFNLSTGEKLSTIDAAIEDVPAQGGRNMLYVDGTLYLVINLGSEHRSEGGYLVAIDTSTLASRNRKLIWALEGKTVIPLNPNLPIVHQPKLNRIIIGAKGQRPVNTGINIKVALDEALSIQADPWDLSSTFNGHRVISGRFNKLFHVEHTSTPVASTHLQQMRITADGQHEEIYGPPILDLFEETDDLSINADEDLLMLPNSCPVAFCISGKGINFVDAEHGVVLPKLKSETIGSDPMMSAFLRP